MKNTIFYIGALLSGGAIITLSSCSKLLDKAPQTQVVRDDSTTAYTASQAASALSGLYTFYKNDVQEFTVLDRITNGDALADNCYAGGDNTANITLDEFTFNSLNTNLNRDWADGFRIIGQTNLVISGVDSSRDASFTTVQRGQVSGEARFIRAFTYFEMVKLFGALPIVLKPADATSSETLLASTIVPRSSIDSIYNIILQDLWFAKGNVRETNAVASKYTVAKGAVYATLAKVYATMATPHWDSVSYYCDMAMAGHSLVGDFTYLWDNNHKNNSEAIWEINYNGYNNGDRIGNWSPSQFIGSGWKKFETPTNDLVAAYIAEGDSVRKHAGISFLDISGQWTDKYWGSAYYPFLVKYNDPNNGTNDFYILRLPDIMLLKAEALVEANNIGGAMNLVNQIRLRVGLGEKTAADATSARAIIALERRLELAFEGHRWSDLLRTNQAQAVMNAQTNGNGVNLGYNIQPYRLLMPIPQTQIDLNPLLTQNTRY